MKANLSCPICKGINVDVGPADGYSQDIRECGSCEAVWTWKGNSRHILSAGNSNEAITELVNEVKSLREEVIKLRKSTEKFNA